MAAAPTIFDELRSAFGEAQDIDGVRIVGRIPAADSEENKAILARVAEAVVQGHAIEEFEIAELRDVIEAVQANPDARLAPEWKKGDPARTPDSLAGVTQLGIRGGRICGAHCGIDDKNTALAIRISLAMGATFANGAVFEGVIFAADTSFQQAKFRGDSQFSNATFLGSSWFGASIYLKAALFNHVTFSEIAWFGNAKFMSNVEFSGTTFTADAQFRDVGFQSAARFSNALFKAIAEFESATFAGLASFERATFEGDPSFNQARFSARTRFDNATFAGYAWFDGTTFVADVWFVGACFKSPTWFGRAAFADNVWFDETKFLAYVGFDEAVFVRKAVFAGTTIRGPVRSDLRTCTVREATAALAANARDLALPIPAVRSKDFWRFRARLAGIWFDWFGWHRVRALGQLAILNRVSLIALLVVPVLAAIYVPLRDALRVHKTTDGVLNPDAPVWLRLAVAALGDDPHLGLTIALAFLAAVCVTLGLLIYQVFAPDEIKKHDEEEHVRDVEARYPEGEPQRDDGLRRALERLEDQATKRPNRHPSFVKHHGDLIWMPPRDKIEWFRDDTLPVVDQLKAIVTDVRKDAGQPDRDAECIDPKAREGFVPGAERARICIEEGARAEYWLRAREYVGWAWVSMGLYGVGLSTLLFILLRQVWLVTKAAGWH